MNFCISVHVGYIFKIINISRKNQNYSLNFYGIYDDDDEKHS